jgi:hypothetical protein
VSVTFRVLAPPGTPADATLYVPGSIPELGPWDPGKLAMTNKGNGIWEATITSSTAPTSSTSTPAVPGSRSRTGEPIVGLTSRASPSTAASRTHARRRHGHHWDSPDVPDDHKAIQFWRDPLVVSTAFADGALTVQFQRDIQPTGADYTGSVAVHGPSSDVPGTLSR